MERGCHVCILVHVAVNVMSLSYDCELVAKTCIFSFEYRENLSLGLSLGCIQSLLSYKFSFYFCFRD